MPQKYKMALSKPCGAESSFCGKLGLKKLQTRDGPTLDERADEEVWEKMSKQQKDAVKREAGIQTPKGGKKKRENQVIFLEGGGQVSITVVGTSKTLMARDYPEIVYFSGKKKLGLIFIPKEIIPKHAIDLFPELIEKAKEELAKAVDSGCEQEETLKYLEKKIQLLEKDNKGDIPEREAGLGIKEVFKTSHA